MSRSARRADSLLSTLILAICVRVARLGGPLPRPSVCVSVHVTRLPGLVLLFPLLVFFFVFERVPEA